MTNGRLPLRAILGVDARIGGGVTGQATTAALEAQTELSCDCTSDADASEATVARYDGWQRSLAGAALSARLGPEANDESRTYP